MLSCVYSHLNIKAHLPPWDFPCIKVAPNHQPFPGLWFVLISHPGEAHSKRSRCANSPGNRTSVRMRCDDVIPTCILCFPGCERADEPLPLCLIKSRLSLLWGICRMFREQTHLPVKLVLQLSKFMNRSIESQGALRWNQVCCIQVDLIDSIKQEIWGGPDFTGHNGSGQHCFSMKFFSLCCTSGKSWVTPQRLNRITPSSCLSLNRKETPFWVSQAALLPCYWQALSVKCFSRK